MPVNINLICSYYSAKVVHSTKNTGKPLHWWSCHQILEMSSSQNDLLLGLGDLTTTKPRLYQRFRQNHQQDRLQTLPEPFLGPLFLGPKLCIELGVGFRSFRGPHLQNMREME